MKRKLLILAGLLAALAVGGFLVAASGIIPIKASSGHWPITAWLLNFSMSRSVSTHTLGMEAPPLDDRALVVKGAAHYEIGCFPCHGSPEQRHPRIAQGMTPHPPYLPPKIREWDPEELFYIVKHGVKFTGMPAWPSQQRDDEVWAMTAFLLELPGLDEEEYRRLVSGDGDPQGEVSPLENLTEPKSVPRAVIENCARCHGADGQGRGVGAFSALAGQSETYLELSLRAFASGQRHSGIMEPIAAGLKSEQMHELARYYSRLERRAPAAAGEQTAASAERGETIAHESGPNGRIPACVHCHGPGDTERNAAYPRLAGQYADYLVLQLELFRSGHRGGTEFAHLMEPVAARLTPEQMRDVAAYYESLSGAGAARRDQ